MPKNWIKNYDELSFSGGRKQVLDLINTAYDSIDTEQVIRNQVSVENNTLYISGKKFDLTKYKSLRVIGFGKVSCKAAYILEQILGSKINEGLAIGSSVSQCELIRTYHGTHPMPSYENVQVAQEIVNMATRLGEDDLVIVIVSGGGSALLCWPMEECRQAQKLYEAFLGSGGTIEELNTVRKHISNLKGGGLAQMLYPAHVIGLVFSDLPGNEYSLIASGPTYLDKSTAEDAERIIKKYNLGDYELNETPKDPKFFEKIVNVPLVSNENALGEMKSVAEKLGIKTKILTSSLYSTVEETVETLKHSLQTHDLVLAGGEVRIIVTKKGGKGGRNSFLGMQMLSSLEPDMTFASFASDGMDNSDRAGIIIDQDTVGRAKQQDFDVKKYIADFNGYTFFEQLGKELINTGPTEANVSDLILLFRNKN